MHIVLGQSASRTLDPDLQSLSDRVRRRLAETLGDGDTSVGSVARTLGMSVPTLQRGLREAGTFFEALIGDVRRQLSMPGVGLGGRSVDEIAFLFGFPDPRGAYWVFHRPTAATSRRYADSTASR